MASPRSPKKIVLKGTSKEIGHQHGSLLSSEIKDQIKVYESMFQSTSSLSWSEVLEIAREFQTTIQKLAPDLYDEMVGIAEGADIDILDIVALNCRSEIALGRFTDGCTSLGWRMQGNEVEGKIVLAQNWDWTEKVQGNLAMVEIERTGKEKIWMVTEAGIVGKIGFNSAGVGVCLNAIRAHPTDTSKLPIHIALRICLESSSVENAIASIEELGGVASSQHVLIADSSKVLSMELSPLGNCFLEVCDDGFVAHTNHFIKNKLVVEPLWLVGSSIRLDRINILASELVGDLKMGLEMKDGVGKMLRRRIFSDTFNTPQAICCPGDPDRPWQTRSVTLFNITMVLDAENSSAEVVFGKPGMTEGDVLRMPWI
ncbi:hypothetical protein SBOR_4481 [Sclerotinia borealis F-4128]|uniref:Peptidase C45 hydrolase domain-containing protein n=1 Tax=Sclerotinia borealis (strain F-4128) TaxID=1432307 RepID=W9CKC0_SCLBF|nr:hypothetical protein SBOR_4481 [Sclerotinia borealis F-4128]